MQEQKGKTFLFFGMIGSGKGTQATLLMNFLKKNDGREIVYACTGHEFRRLIESGNYLGSLVKESVTSGGLQSDFLVDAIFANILISFLTPEKNLIIDGYPRTLKQAENFKEIMKFFKTDLVNIIYIKLNKEEALKRNLLRGRADDTEAGILKRLEEHDKNVIPAMDYLANLCQGDNNYILHTINGEQSVEQVHKDILESLKL
ncbi:MAG: nucleoside monophosphate kinase [Patescibacteria group bacterium]